jgi:hypothetical protein
MEQEPFNPEAVIDAVAPLLGLTIDETSRPQVTTHLEIAQRMASLLFEKELDDREEPGPVFAP